MGAEEGGDKRGLHLKDKFFQTTKEVKMGSWDITMRQSDYELNLRTLPIKDKTENNILLCSYPKFFPL